MVVAKEDWDILRSDEVMDMREQYFQMFGKEFLCFDYADFPGSDIMEPAEMYKQELKKCLREHKPCEIIPYCLSEEDEEI